MQNGIVAMSGNASAKYSKGHSKASFLGVEASQHSSQSEGKPFIVAVKMQKIILRH